MDESKKMILEKRIEKTMKALEKNKMKPFYAENRQQALELVKELLHKRSSDPSGRKQPIA